MACERSCTGQGPVAGALVLPGAAGFQLLVGMSGRAEGGSLLGRMRHTRVQAHTGSESWHLQELCSVGPFGTLLLPIF